MAAVASPGAERALGCVTAPFKATSITTVSVPNDHVGLTAWCCSSSISKFRRKWPRIHMVEADHPKVDLVMVAPSSASVCGGYLPRRAAQVAALFVAVQPWICKSFGSRRRRLCWTTSARVPKGLLLRAGGEPSANILPAFATQAPPIAEYGVEQPVRTRAALVIQNRIVAEPHYQAVLRLVEECIDKFDTINLVCALHVLAITARDHEALKWPMQSDPNFVLLFRTAKEAVMADVSAQTPRTLSDLLWCCARLSIIDSDLFNEIVVDATKRLEQYTSYGIGLIVFALGFSGQRPRAIFMQSLVREMRARIDCDFQPQHVTMIVYGMMRLEIRDDRLMMIVSEHLLKFQMDNGYDDVSMLCLAYAYAKLEYWSDEVFGLLGRKVTKRLKHLDARLVSMAALSFSLSCEHIESSGYTMQVIVRAMEDQLQSDFFDFRSFATLCYAIGKYRYATSEDRQATGKTRTVLPGKDGDTMAAMLISCVMKSDYRELKPFDASELNLINYAIMRMKHRDANFLLAVANMFSRRAPELHQIEIVNCVYAMARLEYVHLPFLKAMLAEVRRRSLLDSMEPLSIATLMYSLAMSRLDVDDIVEKVAEIVCERVREFECQQVTMILYAMAILNVKDGEAIVSTILEDVVRRKSEYSASNVACCLWAAAILSGPAAGIWMLKLLFDGDFWSPQFEEQSYSMIYNVFVVLGVEWGLKVEDMRGYGTCRRIYEEQMATTMGMQNQRLSKRLKMFQVPNVANGIPPALEGFAAPGVFADIAIPQLKLVIEVEGPKRMTIPFNKLIACIEEEDKAEDFRSADRKEAEATVDNTKAERLKPEDDLRRRAGRPEEMVSEARSRSGLGFVGSAEFKRRLLTKCGYNVITINFEENEDYIANALKKTVEKGSEDKGATADSNVEEEGSSKEQGATEGGASDSDVVDGNGADMEDPPALDDDIPKVDLPLITEETPYDKDGTNDMSAWEAEFRKKFAQTFREMKRKITQERGDAASFQAYATHLDYRRWQVGLEKQMMAKLVKSVQA